MSNIVQMEARKLYPLLGYYHDEFMAICFIVISDLSKAFNCIQSVTKYMGKTAIWAILCSYPLPTLNNVEKQQAKFASSYVMSSQNCIGGEGDF